MTTLASNTLTTNTFTTNDGTTIYYKDWGKGKPVTFSHGWPLNADAWDAQMLFLAQHGYRVIAHDRRGHGRSGQTWDGNEMDTYADDLAGLLDALDIKGRHDGGPFYRRRRSGSLPGTTREQAGVEGGADWRRSSNHVENGAESRGLAPVRLRSDS